MLYNSLVACLVTTQHTQKNGVLHFPLWVPVFASKEFDAGFSLQLPVVVRLAFKYERCLFSSSQPEHCFTDHLTGISVTVYLLRTT